jgi:DNA-binding MarR family transcriptional regulator
MKRDFSQRFGFLVNDVAKLYGEQFDRLARERIGLSRAQCRVLGALATHGDEAPLSQTELAQRLDLSAMAVGGLCDRLESAGWIRRLPHHSDRRIREVHLAPSAEKALDAALTISDGLQARALARLSATERAQLVALLGKARLGLMSLASAEEEEASS